jgi:hypothetical protein
MAGNTDDTVILPPRQPRKSSRRPWLAALLVAAIGLMGVGVVQFWPRQPAPQGGRTGLQPAIPAIPGETILNADEAQIRANIPATLTVFRFAPNPTILVLDFPTLSEQGRMLNRIAALIEKSGVPHDRLLSDSELAEAIRSSGTTADTYYYGHDYPASAIKLFFELADRDKVALNADERRLQRLAAQAAAEPLGFGALISIVRADAANEVDPSARAAILHHELSHGEYFTNAIYARFVGTIWQDVLTQDERAQFRTYLGTEGYDTSLEDLMINEMQAYLMHTPDLRFFDPTRLAITPARFAAIRAAFAAGMPSCWLRAETPGVIGNAPAGATGTIPVSAPRRRPQRAGTVSRRMALAARLPPRRRRASIAV